MQCGDLVIVSDITWDKNAQTLKPLMLDPGEVGIIIRDIGGGVVEVYLKSCSFRIPKNKLDALETKHDIIMRAHQKQKNVHEHPLLSDR